MTRPSKRPLRWGLVALLSGAVLCGGGWVAFRMLFVRPLAYFPVGARNPALAGPLLGWDEHDRAYKTAPEPMVVRLAARSGGADGGSGSGELLYVGVKHTQDAADPVLAKIEHLWQDFKPTAALCEGRTRRFIWASRPARGTFTESDLVFVLAQQTGVRCLTLEPPYEIEVEGLLRSFPKDVVAAYVTLRGVLSESQGKSPDPDGLALDLLRKRTDLPALSGAISDIAGLDAVWRRLCPDAPDWRALAGFPDGSCFGEIGDASREVRGRHMMSVLAELAERGERVFAVVGKSHVIRQESLLRVALQGPQSEGAAAPGG